jgi:hypothetical protein
MMIENITQMGADKNCRHLARKTVEKLQLVVPYRWVDNFIIFLFPQKSRLALGPPTPLLNSYWVLAGGRSSRSMKLTTHIPVVLEVKNEER